MGDTLPRTFQSAMLAGFQIPNLMPQPAPPSTVSVSGNRELVPTVYRLAKQLPPMQDWSIRVVPDTLYRQAIVARGISGKEREQGLNVASYSDPVNKITYMPESLIRNQGTEFVQRTLAHEYGHLTLNTSDENKANKWADEWMKSNSGKQ